jgi:hypothetical protein
MKREEAALFFGNLVLLGRALGISPSAISQWPETLTIRQQDEVIGAAIRLNKITPEQARELIEHERQRDERITSERDRSDGRRPQLESRPEL